MPEVEPDSQETCTLLERIGRGDRKALERLLARYRPRLHAFVEVRLDRRLRARVDPSDVVQEAQLEVVRRMDDFLRRQPMPFHLWVRKTAYKRLLNLRRDHRRRARRSVDREIPWPEHSSLLLAGPLLAGGPSPSQQLAAREFAERVAGAVAELAEDDREILLMRKGQKGTGTFSQKQMDKCACPFFAPPDALGWLLQPSANRSSSRPAPPSGWPAGSPCCRCPAPGR